MLDTHFEELLQNFWKRSALRLPQRTVWAGLVGRAELQTDACRDANPAFPG